uniref:Uncharacterized protein n=1 Tax=Moniliophthora roreri TaxID=221103 RepID=A0A0W0FTD2_MONRR
MRASNVKAVDQGLNVE